MNPTVPGTNRPDLVLLHGWGLGQAAWNAVLPALEARFNVSVLALPGYGSTQPHPFPSFVETATQITRAIPQDAYVCGWSLGALLALQVAILAPRRLSGLILVSGTASFVQRDDWPAAQPPALLDAFCDAVEQDASGALQRFVALFNQGDTQARAIGRALNRQLQAAPPADSGTLLDGLGWLRDVDLREKIAAIDTPALIIHGANDTLMPLGAGQWLAENLRGARLTVMPGAAHAPFLNDPEFFANLIGEYCHAAART
ncbi:MAG: alpha/beta fold hydrolase [Propionivibrio sp.]